MKPAFEIGQRVRKVAPDYTANRVGVIVDVQTLGVISKLSKVRYRVRWEKEADGKPINWPKGYQTWTAQERLMPENQKTFTGS